MGKKTRFLLLILSVVLFSALFVGAVKKGIEKVQAIPGQINYGSNTASSIQYINQKTVYSSDLYFGKQGFAGALTSDGEVRIGSNNAVGSVESATLPSGYLFEVLGRAKSDGVSIGTTDNAYKLEVSGTNPSYGDAARFQGNVGIGQGVDGPFGVPLTILQPTPGAAIATLKDSAGSSANLGVSATALTLDKALTSSGPGKSSFAGNVGIGSVDPGAKLVVKDGGVPISVERTASSTNDLGGAINLQRTTTADMADGFGVGLNFIIQDTSGTPNTVGQLFGIRDGADTSGALSFKTLSGASYPERMRIASSGNVGIGISSPNAKLDIGGTSSLISNTSGNLNITPASNLLVTQGNVGIGAASPRGKLDVDGPGDIYLADNTTAGTTQSLYLPGHIFISPYNGANISYLQARRSDDSGSTNLQIRTWNAGAVKDAMYIASNGNVGISTSTPATLLDVRGTTPAITVGNVSNAEGALYFGNAAHGIKRNYSGANDVGLYTTSGTVYLSANGTATNHLAVTNAGNVGIGNATGTYKLHVTGDVYANGGWFRSSGAMGLYNESYGMYFYPIDGNASYWGSRSNYGLKIATLAGANQGYVYHDGGSNFGLLGSAGSWAVRIPSGTNNVYMANTYASKFWDADDTGRYIDPNGSSYVYYLSASNGLSAYGTSIGNTSISFASGYGPYIGQGYNGGFTISWGYMCAECYADFGESVWNKIRFNMALQVTRGYTWSCCGQDATLGLGEPTNTNPALRASISFHNAGQSEGEIELASSGSRRIYFHDHQSQGLGIETTGNAWKPGGGSWNASSDRRVKKDVSNFSDGLGKLRQIRPVNYVYNGLGENPKDFKGIGVIAQEIQPVMPYTISTQMRKLHPEDKKATELLYFDPSALTYVTINAVKELDTSLNALSRELNYLKLNETGSLSIAQDGTNYQVKNTSTNSIFKNIAAFAEVVIGKLKAGIIETKKLIVDNVDILQKLTDTENKLREATDKIQAQEKKIEEMNGAIRALQEKVK